MAIAVKTNNKRVLKEKPFPKLQISLSGAIWLMQDEDNGVYLCGGEGIYRGDIIQSGFGPLEDFNESVTIKNEQ